MGKTVSGKLEIDVEWEVSEQGVPEERACFAAVGILCNDIRLTEGTDGFVKRIRPAPYLSAYHLAEWLAWNWWRLRWEPKTSSPSTSWAFAHRMATVGHGYVWPNITIFSDGERIALVAKPTQDRNKDTFRYISDAASVVGALQFENAIDEFIEQVRGQLLAERLNETNLEKIWAELNEERRSTEATQRRKLEALLGFDPDEANKELLDRLVFESRDLGAEASNEIAANRREDGEIRTPHDLISIAEAKAPNARPTDAVRLRRDDMPRRQDAAGWKRGASAAVSLRAQEGLGERPISNSKLAQMAGVQESVLMARVSDADVSFAFDETSAAGKILLRSKWEAGRRFELARIIGDKIMVANQGKFFPATASYTYRQKAQRSFAAELLCPFDAIDGMLAGDYSGEAQLDVADEFNVSEVTIRTSLMNHGRIEREGSDSMLGETF
jgi:hypothetical protein